MSKPVITRFAPSPTGNLHLGHVKSAIFSAEEAWDRNGRFLLRVEDIDFERCKTEYEDSNLDDLAFLGLHWEEPVLRQSEHMSRYVAAVEKLAQMGVTYPCFCSRRQINETLEQMENPPTGPDGPLYPGTCRHMDKQEAAERIARGDQHKIRINLDKALEITGTDLDWVDLTAGRQIATPQMHGDVVIARHDIPTSYHISVTIDDHLQGITLVTRGHDLFHATHIHRVLQALLGLDVPEYHHHDLILDQSGSKLSKRRGEHPLLIRNLRNDGLDAEEIRAMAGYPDWKYAP